LNIKIRNEQEQNIVELILKRYSWIIKTKQVKEYLENKNKYIILQLTDSRNIFSDSILKLIDFYEEESRPIFNSKNNLISYE
jgi:hypothetical protein